MSNKAYWDRLEAAGHLLKRKESGEVDYFAFAYEYHNGPVCELCGEFWCHHCEDDIEPCTQKAIESTCQRVES